MHDTLGVLKRMRARDPFAPKPIAWVLFIAGAFVLPSIYLTSCDSKTKTTAPPPTTQDKSFEPGPFGLTGDDKVTMSADGSVALMVINGHVYRVAGNVVTELQPPKP